MTEDQGAEAIGQGFGSLRDTRWVLTELDEGPVALDRSPTLAIGADDEVSGLAGCNRFVGRAVIGEMTISIGPLALTRMLCPGPLMALERAYVAALEQVSTWHRDGARLELSSGDGIVRLLFRAAGDVASV